MKINLTNPALDKKGSARVIRGGNYFNAPSGLRASNRVNYSPSYRFSARGFRLVRNK